MICEQCQRPLEFLEVIFQAQVTEARCVGGHDGEVKVLAHLVGIEPRTDEASNLYQCGSCHAPLPAAFNYEHWCEWAAEQSTKQYHEQEG